MASIRDSRRLPGPNLLSAAPGVVLDIAGEAREIEALVLAWHDRAHEILAAVGWETETTQTRIFEGGASLFLTAPVDALYAATEVNEWAFDAALAEIEDEPTPDLARAASRLADEITRESNPALMRLRAEAERRGVLFLMDPDRCSVGAGDGCRVFDVDRVPVPGEIDWEAVHDVPVALVTGTNGKSTTVRAIASMVQAAGLVPGLSSTDGILAGDVLLDRGDYSGPEGARSVLRATGVEVAVLETARGGMLRRGLAVPRADVAALLNVAPDHLGEFGVDALDDLIATKLVIRHAVAREGAFVMNDDDVGLRAWRTKLGFPADAFSTRARPSGETVAWVEDGALVLERGPHKDVIAPVDEIPMTLGGAAAYNVENALAAVLVGARLGLAAPHLRQGLLAFVSDAAHNPGRGNLFVVGGARVLVDYAHNPHGIRAIFETAARLDAKRTLVLLGQAGDRSDEAIRELADIAWAHRPDRVVIKELGTLLRGRTRGEVPDLLEARLHELGATEDRLARADSELEAVDMALRWAQPGDLLLLLVHADRAAVLERLQA